MLYFLKALNRIPKSRLSRRLVFVVFISIVIIEAIILIPSVIRRKNEFYDKLKNISEAQVSLIKDFRGSATNNKQIPVKCRVNNPIDCLVLQEFSQLKDFMAINLGGQLEHKVIGGAFYNKNGQLIGQFGEIPRLSFKQVEEKDLVKLAYQSYFDAAWTSQQMEGQYVLILRHDAATVSLELQAFIWRIVGLVIIISIFVTGGIWIALDPIAIAPILQLRKDLIHAGEAIVKDEQKPKFDSASIQRQDELGDVIAAFEKMFGQITQAISDRKKAEIALQKSLDTVKAYSDALDNELEKGREIQRNFLPEKILEKHNYEIAAFFKPARQVAGDFYDTFELADGSIALVIADVCDKGVGAALFMALFRSLIRIFSLKETETEILEAHTPINGSWIGKSKLTNLIHLNALQAVSLTNNYVAQNHGNMGMFATLFLGILEPKTGLLTYINGGHEPLFIIDRNGTIKEHLNSTGPAVGMLPDLEFKIKQTYLQSGQLLLGYTDGVTEARDRSGKFFSQEKLLFILQNRITSAQTLLNKIAASVIAHTGQAEQFDDITLLAIKRF